MRLAGARPSVLVIQRRMTEYRVPFFDQLRQRLAGSSIDLEVASGRGRRREVSRADAAELSWGTTVPTWYLPLGRRFVARLRLPRLLLARQDLIVVPHENSLLLNSLPLLNAGRNRRRVAFWGHAAVARRTTWPDLFAGLRAWTAKRADWWFAYTSRSVARLAEIGFPSERVTCVNNAVDVRSLVQWRTECDDERRAVLVRDLGLSGDHVAVFLGSMGPRKRLDALFAVADQVRSALPPFELVIIGDGPMGGLVRREAGRRPWVRWVGSRHGREKVLYASLGKVLLNPGMVGLVMLDSFALALPLVTVDAPIHSPEIAYLDNGRNGLMVPDEAGALARATVSLLADDDRRRRMAAECLRDAAHYSMEAMVERFAGGIERALVAPVRPS